MAEICSRPCWIWTGAARLNPQASLFMRVLAEIVCDAPSFHMKGADITTRANPYDTPALEFKRGFSLLSSRAREIARLSHDKGP